MDSNRRSGNRSGRGRNTSSEYRQKERAPRTGYTSSDMSEFFFQEPEMPARHDRRVSAGSGRRPASNRAAHSSRPTKTTARKKPKATLHLEKPWRLAGVLGVFVFLLVLIVTRAIGSSGTESSGGNVQESSSSADSDTSVVVPLETGRVTQLANVPNQVMGFLGGMVISHPDNYPHDPEKPEEESAANTTAPASYTYCVVIDPGHGGDDTGNTNEDVVESSVVMDYAEGLRDAIREIDSSIEVILTRTSDEYLELGSRIAAANEAKADLFISLHCDTYDDDPSVSGVACQYWDGEESTERGQKSAQAAEKLSARAAQALELPDRGASNAVMEVLYETEMPSVLLQLGFLSNETDRMALLDETKQKTCINALSGEIVDLLSTYTPRRDSGDSSDASGDSAGDSGDSSDASGDSPEDSGDSTES